MDVSFPLLLGCLAVGVVLIALEVFLTPGLGVKLLIGCALILTAVVLAYAQHGALKGTLVLGLAAAILTGGGWVAKRTLGKRLVLGAALEPPPAKDADVASLVGRDGVALSMLRPSGIAVFGAQRVDVTTEGEFLEPGTPVVVVAVEGHVVRVKRRA
jgi:membrane-bound serine protease (ClpP class)